MKEWRNKWIKVRNREINSSSFFVPYYFEHCKAKKCLEKHEFEAYFPLYFQRFQEQIVEYFDQKWAITTIINRENEIIKFI